jgi:hypothetical protein
MKKVIPAVIVAFTLYYVVSQPESAAHLLSNATNMAKQGAASLVTFMGSLGGGTIAVLILVGVAYYIVSKR